jgi:hypothetical protein
MHKGARLTSDHADPLMSTSRVLVACFTDGCSEEHTNRNSLILGTRWVNQWSRTMSWSSFEDKEEDTMLAKLRVGFLLVKSLMTCVGIIVMSVCGIFIRLRLVR